MVRSLQTAGVVTALTLGVWLAFYFAEMPLDRGSTAVVAMAFGGVVAVGQALRSWWRKDARQTPSSTSQS